MAENDIKFATLVSESFEVGPGNIAAKTFLDIKFPKGHIGVKSFDVELVDEDGNSVPLYETYIHHWFAIKYFENITLSRNIKQYHDLRNGDVFQRNQGTCQGYMLPHYWGLGAESRGTSSNLPDPFAEYTIQRIHDSDSPHVQKANIPMEKGGYLIYGTVHMHTGVVNATLYGQDGRILCTSSPKYGTGKEAGNEKGYVVGMSGCYPKPGSMKIKDGEILTLESRYENKFRTGAMGQFYIYLADQLQTKVVKD
ncbi:hypothetical protein Fmac_028909 [Flemingia macrophylla]|uniref:Stress up-regulated Nod 19 n=1 Tax=Flemingia macrophylla TaxID=520843 RepID=A0ABD1LAB0_9FABA